MLPLTFEHCRFAASSEKLTSKWFGCVPDLLSILGKHRFIMNRQCYNQVGFYLKLLLLLSESLSKQTLNVRRTYSKLLGRSLCMLPRGVPRFDSLDRIFEGPLQHTPPDRSEYETEHSSPQVLALPNDDHVNIGRAIWLTREGVGVARRPAPDIGVGRR